MCILTDQQNKLAIKASFASSAAFIFSMRNKNIILRECSSTELGLDFEVKSAEKLKCIKKCCFINNYYLEGYIKKLTEDVTLQESL